MSGFADLTRAPGGVPWPYEGGTWPVDVVEGTDWNALRVEDIRDQDGQLISLADASYRCEVWDRLGGVHVISPLVDSPAPGVLQVYASAASTKNLAGPASARAEHRECVWDLSITKDGLTVALFRPSPMRIFRRTRKDA